MLAMNSRDIPAKVAPYVHTASVLVGLMYGGLATRSPVQKSVLQKENIIQVWMGSPYSSLTAGFVGFVWASAWLFFRTEKRHRWETTILCFFLGASAGALVISLSLLRP